MEKPTDILKFGKADRLVCWVLALFPAVLLVALPCVSPTPFEHLALLAVAFPLGLVAGFRLYRFGTGALEIAISGVATILWSLTELAILGHVVSILIRK